MEMLGLGNNLRAQLFLYEVGARNIRPTMQNQEWSIVHSVRRYKPRIIARGYGDEASDVVGQPF